MNKCTQKKNSHATLICIEVKIEKKINLSICRERIQCHDGTQQPKNYLELNPYNFVPSQ